MAAYRWERASGGEIPAGAYEKGHGFGDDEDRLCGPLWVARSLPDAGGAVRLGYVERGHQAVVGGGRDRIDEYEVLLDRGVWRHEFDEPLPDPVVVGSNADGTPLHAVVSDEEQWGLWPRERAQGGSSSWCGWFLLDPGERGLDQYPWEQSYDYHASQSGGGEEEPAAAEPAAAAHPVVAALDLRKEVVVIANPGTEEIDLAGWKVCDDSQRKPYVFRAGTLLGPGASVRLRSGPDALRPGPGELTWTTALVWNDSGDTAFLESPEGEVVSTSRD